MSEEVSFALDALAAEVGVWDDRATVLHDASRAAEGLTLGLAEFSWMSGHSPITTTYNEAQARFTRLLREGGEVAEDIAGRLESAREQYAADVEAGVNAVAQIN